MKCARMRTAESSFDSFGLLCKKERAYKKLLNGLINCLVMPLAKNYDFNFSLSWKGQHRLTKTNKILRCAAAVYIRLVTQ